MHNTNSVVRRGKYGIRGDQTQNKLISEAIGDNQRKLTKQMITSFCHTPTHCARLIWGTYGMERTLLNCQMTKDATKLTNFRLIICSLAPTKCASHKKKRPTLHYKQIVFGGQWGAYKSGISSSKAYSDRWAPVFFSRQTAASNISR